MTAPAAVRAGVRRVDLTDAAACAGIDAFVRARADATPFHLTAWSRGIERGTGQRATYLAVTDADGAVAGVLPLTCVRSPLFGTAMVSAGFGVDGGVLADDASTALALIEAAWVRTGAVGATSLELRGGVAPGAGFVTDTATYLGFRRDIAGDDAALLAAIPRKQRAEVRRAETFGLTVAVGRGADDLAAHWRVYGESVRNLGTPVFPRRLFASILDAFGDDADILTVRHDGVPLASVLSLYLAGTVYPYWGGGTAAARGLRANDHMYHALMRHARGRGCSGFDFGRSKAGTGAAAFKRNWGFEGRPLAYHVRTADGAAPRSVNPLDPRHAARIRLWKRLPLPVANLVGPMIARGLG